MKSSFNIKHHWNKILKGSSDGQWSQVSILSVIEIKFWKVLVLVNEVKIQFKESMKLNIGRW